MTLSLSIVIPAYNEEGRIGRSLDEILAFLSSADYTAEVIVVDDGSNDQTSRRVEERVESFNAAGHQLRVLKNEPNRGKGYSVKRGLMESRGEIVLFTDADLSSPITEAPKLITPIAERRAEVAFGSRALNRKLIGKRQPVLRDFGGRIFNLLMKGITGLKFKDTQCGFKAFRREQALAVFRLQSIDRFGFDPEILYIAKKQGLRLLEMPVVWNDSEGTKISFFSDSLKMSADLVRIRMNDLSGRYDHLPHSLGVKGAAKKASNTR